MALITDKFGKASIDTDYAIATTVEATRAPGVTVLEAVDLSKFADDTPVFFVTYKKTTNPTTGEVTVVDLVSWKALVNTGANTLTNLTLAPGYTDLGNDEGDFIECIPTAFWENSLVDGIQTTLKPDGTLDDDTVTAESLTQAAIEAVTPTGMMTSFAGFVAPSGWLLCDGAAVSRSTYSALFNLLNPSLGTFTVTIATPGVVTITAHGLQTGDPIYLTTTGALPTGLAANTRYFAIRIDANTLRIATSQANAAAGTAINTTGSQSGVHTLRRSPYGVGDGSTTFNVPDARGRVLAGADAMGGTAASRLTLQKSQGSPGRVGSVGGAESHTLTTAEQANAIGSQAWHGGESSTIIAGWGGIISTSEVYGGGYKAPPATTGGANSARYGWTIDLGFGGGSHNNVQPTIVTNTIIKT
jgi:microcystin-dependent protein